MSSADSSAETVPVPAARKLVYAYTVPGRKDERWTRSTGQVPVSGRGLIKVGETTKASAAERIKQQLNTAYPGLVGVDVLLEQEAKRADGTWFGDRDVHRALVAAGIARVGGEWFEATIDEVKAAIVSVKSGTEFQSHRTHDFPMRPEQETAVALTAGRFTAHGPVERDGVKRPSRFLWNAKMRFGKTFTTYQLAREMGWKRVLVLTYKPVVQSAWRDDLLSHVDFDGWEFVDRSTSNDDRGKVADSADPVVWFASFQDLSGKNAEGQVKSHNETIHLTDWDCIVLDEYHFGAWRDGARELYDPSDKKLAESEEPDEWVTAEDDLGLSSDHILYLSGTPFRAITNGEFSEDEVFNWTYVDEQSSKEVWDDTDGPNPYADLPGMQMFAYEMGSGASAQADDGEFDGFSLSEYFKAYRADPEDTSSKVGPGSYVFSDPTRVSEFLEMLRGKLSEQMKMNLIGGTSKKAPFPYESPDFADAIQHSVWYLADVGACHAMADMLRAHPYFSGFVIHVAAGPKAGMGANAKPPVEQAVKRADKENASGSITLSCGKLMTGVTIREWGAILMLRSLKSPETYFQAAFRVQSPWSVRGHDGSVTVLKDPVYVFEFDPNRALAAGRNSCRATSC